MRPILVAIALSLGASTLAPSWVQAAPATAPAKSTAADVQEAKDRQIVQAAMATFAKGSLDPATIKALKQVLDHAPAAWPIVQDLPGGHKMIHVNDPSPVGTLSALLNATGAPGSEPGQTVSVAFNTYGLAALMLGSRAIALRQPDEATIWLDKGLAFQPDNLMLVTEKGMAFTLQRRFAEALALYDAQPPQDPLAKPVDPDGMARIQRARGYCLIELGRLDEAEAAYNKSLELEPGHGGAKAEMDYIREAKAGKRPSQPVTIMNGQEAKDYKPN
jgi:tetratricopeptide (TPR) repeat protein